MKVGDKVRVTKRLYGHDFNIGEIVTLVEDCRSDWQCKGEGFYSWHLKECEFEAIEEDKYPHYLKMVLKEELNERL